MEETMNVLHKAEKKYIDSVCRKTQLQVTIETLHAIGGSEDLIQAYEKTLDQELELEARYKALWIKCLDKIEDLRKSA